MRAAQKASQIGFTLIELLIVISIITIITGASIPNFNNYIKGQNVKQAQEQVKDDLRTIQNRALNGQDSTVELGGVKVAYWGVEFTQDSPTYDFFISTDDSSCGVTRQEFRTSSPLPGGSVIRSGDGCLFFSFANGDATFAPASIATVIVIVGEDTGLTGCRRLEVTPVGLIQTDNSEESCE